MNDIVYVLHGLDSYFNSNYNNKTQVNFNLICQNALKLFLLNKAVFSVSEHYYILFILKHSIMVN